MPVFLNNIDDYLGPSQACVNPLFTAPAPASNFAEDREKDATSDDVKLSEGSVKVVASRHRKQQRRAPRISYDEKSTQANNLGDSVRLECSSSTNKNNESNSIDIIDSTTHTIKTKKKATVTLSDCLACTGCVTSAEAVLMSHHSIDKLKELCAQQQIQSGKQKKIVFTISPASLSDLYRHLYLEGNENILLPSRKWLLAKVSAFLHEEFGAGMVIDGTVPQTISLLESANEFCYRYRKRMSVDESIETVSGQALPSIALSSTQTRFINKQSNVLHIGDDETSTEVAIVNHSPGRTIEEDKKGNAPYVNLLKASLPMLSSSCPGFVCLVEKTASVALPLLSSAKSPMAVAGTLIKTGMCSEGVAKKKDLFHVAVMPCHDKKLEAGRGDFSWEEQTLINYGSSFQDGRTLNETIENATGELVKEVDMVLTTSEVLEVMVEAANQKAISNATNASSVDLIRCFLNDLRDPLVGDLVLLDTEDVDVEDGANEQNVELYGSGSYADYIFRYAAWDLFNCKLPLDRPLPWADSSQTNNPVSDAGNSGVVIRRRRKRPDMSGLRELSLYRHTDGTYSCTKPQHAASVAPSLSFATAYGFKNVQTILQSLSKKVSRDKSAPSDSDYHHHYIEIMACPSGCPNGGGQIGAERRETPRESIERVKRVAQTIPRVRQKDGLLPLYYGSIEPFSRTARSLFHTNFHAVPELELSTGASAGVAFNDMKW